MNALSQAPIQIDVETFDRLRRDTDEVCLLDVREDWERALCSIEPCLGVPLGQLPDRQPIWKAASMHGRTASIEP